MRNLLVAQSGGPTAAINATVAGVVSCAVPVSYTHLLEEGEKQTVETMIKCIVVASGNDASVAMACLLYTSRILYRKLRAYADQ